MKFAHFSHVWAKTGMTPVERYEQLWRELQLSDELGYDFAFCVEHHFFPQESLMSAPSLFAVAGGARTRRLRLGSMGYIVPLHQPLRLVEEIAIVDQMLNGRMEVGLVSGILPAYFSPFNVDYKTRREVALEFVQYLRAAFVGRSPFSFEGKYHNARNVRLAVNPVQQPHPPLWIESRDAQTLEFCAREGIHTGYFYVFPRGDAAPVYRKYHENWCKAGWKLTPNIAYNTIVYVDETDERAIARAHAEVTRSYRRIADMFAKQGPGLEAMARMFEGRGEAGAAEIIRNMLDTDYLLDNDIIFVGSPATVARKLKACAADGYFNTLFCEFNFGDLDEADLMRSIRLFGSEVMPQLRDFEPF